MGTSVLSLGPDAQRQVAEQLRAQQLANIPAVPPPESKYHNHPTRYKSVQGFERVYDSKLEAHWASNYDMGIQKGLIKLWLPQVPFPLHGGVTYRLDFLVVWSDGHLSYVDCKGKDTQASINKRKQVKALFGVDVEIVRRA